MLRQILVPLDTKEFTPVATRIAVRIAKDVNQALGRDVVSLLGLGIVDLDQLPMGRFATLVPRDDILKEAREQARAAMRQFEKVAVEQGIAPQFVKTHFTEGAPFTAIMHHHVFSDLVVMGPTCCFPPVSVDYDTLDNLYHRASRPILLTPTDPREVKSVIMVMDGTAPSSRLLYAYAHLHPFPKAKIIVARSPFEEQYHELKDFFDRVQGYLESFGFTVEQVTTQGRLIESLPALAEKHHAGAIALGVHAEHFLDRVRNPLQLMLPGVKALLADCRAMLFTVH